MIKDIANTQKLRALDFLNQIPQQSSTRISRQGAALVGYSASSEDADGERMLDTLIHYPGRAGGTRNKELLRPTGIGKSRHQPPASQLSLLAPLSPQLGCLQGKISPETMALMSSPTAGTRTKKRRRAASEPTHLWKYHTRLQKELR